ncbi:tetratricopeptide repeat protein [Pseudoxanthomonas indica]|uniref:Tetratricopeptide repeat-containing protein n=1 Tax=Pseudoxanthomonas indica TaxID=428993 RepID=A0A1T5LWP9_9GAMM|nr:tetratricopeptide repeat protein [Pseudoxanthomonas indica]GGD41293.1 hypothetical protein GCM10007235_11660 [Pseudoxanthomonas indica]SKC80407.1 Tetratricopeptide repeat-containing protein [Pseudoxanthomonas indica]
MATWLIALALALAPTPPIAAVEVIAPPPSPEEILAVPPPMHSHLQHWLDQTQADAKLRPEEKLERLVAFLFDNERGLGLTYQYDANHTVEQVYATRRVNCLSFTLTVIALARDIGLNAYAQEIEDVLTWFQEGNTVYRNNHVNAGIRIRSQRFSVDVAWDEVITRQQPKEISDTHLFALFYSNRAVALLGKGQIEGARAYMARALALDQAYAPIWNNLGVLHLRQGDNAEAERDYQRALAVDSAHSPALFNLSSLYTRTGRLAEAKPLQKQLEQIRARDPFDQFLLALDAERKGEYAAAVTYYQRAIRLYDGEHRFYQGLARAYLHMGDSRRAGRALAHAQRLTEGAQKAQYQAKLERLRSREIEGQRLFGADPRR